MRQTRIVFHGLDSLRIIVFGFLFGVILQTASLQYAQAAETPTEPKSEGLFPEGFNSLAYTDNQLSVIDMLLANEENPGMEPIFDILENEDLSAAGFNSLLTQMSGSVRFNGMRLSMSSPWLSIMNRTRVIGQWENHIIAEKDRRRREKFFSRDGSVLLAQSSDDDSNDVFIPNEKKNVSEGIDSLDDDSYEMTAGEMVVQMDCLGKHSKNLWFTPIHNATNVGGHSDTPGFHISRTGFMTGIEKGHCPCTNYGVAFGYTAPSLYQGRDSISADDVVFGLYFKKKLKNDLYVNLWLGYGNQKFKQTRYITIPDLDQGYKYEGQFSGNSFTASVEVSRAIYCRKSLVVRPLAAFDYQHAQQEGFAETGRGPFALTYGSFSYDTKIARCGFATQIGASDGSSKMTIRQRIYYARQIGDEAYPSGSAFYQIGGSSTRMELRGYDVSRDYMILGTGGQIDLDPTRTCQLYGDYDAIVTNSLTTHAVSLGLIQRF